MRCPEIGELPTPPAGRIGWPWTVESRLTSTLPAEGYAWPRISVITPSFNQGQFIEETIRSILLQGYPDLEYFVLDGGSTDGSVEIIQKYAPWLTYWVSEPDGGQSDAINRGLKRASGDFSTWINSDDMLCKNALIDHASQVGFDADTVYIGICLYIDRTSRILSSHRGRIRSLEDLVRIRRIWRDGGQIVQPEVLFPRQLALSVGGLNRDNHFTMDFEFWGRLLLAGVKFQYTQIQFGMFREHPEQKTRETLKLTESLLNTAARLIRVVDDFSDEKKADLLSDLDTYNADYRKAYWKSTGRLAKLGLPRELVTSLRALKMSLQPNSK